MSVPELRFKGFFEKWKSKKLASVATITIGLTYSPNNIVDEKNGILVLRSSNIQNGVLSFDDNVFVDLDVPEHLIVKKGDILLCTRNGSRTLIGKAAIINDDSRRMTFGAFMGLVRSEHSAFIFQLMQTKEFKRQIHENLGATINQITNKDLSKIKFYFPSLEEQQKIASFLSLLDQKIEKQQEKIEQLELFKKGMMQKLFSRKIRFKDEKGREFPEWEEMTLNSVIKQELRPVPKPDKPYIRLGLRSHAKGTFHELVEKPEEVQMDEMFVVKKDDLIVNITFAWEQAIAVANEDDDGKLVSHRFPTYIFKKKHYSGFFKYFLTTRYIKYCLTNASPGGAGRNRVLNKSDFLEILIKVPSLREQQKIASYLSKIDLKIDKERERLVTLRECKLGFMQQMFV